MGSLEPPLPFDRLCTVFFTSNSLRQNIDAYVTNIESFGDRPVPGGDMWGPRAEQNVRDMLTTFHFRDGKEEPTDAEVKAAWDEWKKIAAVEKSRLMHFFEFIHPDHTFTEIRRRKRFDEELLGNAAWEIVNNRGGDMSIFNPVPFVTLRLMPLDKVVTEVEMKHKTDPITIGSTVMNKRFRRFIQIQDTLPAVWFKEFGDPRTLSSRTGRFYDSPALLQVHEEGTRPATEILHFSLYAPNESYGIARWIGNLISVMGSRMSEEVNFLYFENKGVPPLAIIFSGGRIAADSVGRLESFIEQKIKGQSNYHSVLIIEAESEGGDAKNTGRGQIKIQPLTEAQQQDALFQKYDQRNIDKVGASFRLPGLLRGDIKELNRATAEVAQALAEQQVFQPERDAFDAVMDRKILVKMNIRFWKFKTNRPVMRDPKMIADIIGKLAAAGVLMPDEARELIAEALGVDLPRRDDEFLSRPLRLAIAEERSRSAQARREQQQQDKNPPGRPPKDGETGVADMSVTGGLPQPTENGSDRDRQRVRRRAMVVLAKDLVEVKALMERGEIVADVVKMSDEEFDEVFGTAGATT
jgi:PBSX family phage portal protein